MNNLDFGILLLIGFLLFPACIIFGYLVGFTFKIVYHVLFNLYGFTRKHVYKVGWRECLSVFHLIVWWLLKDGWDVAYHSHEIRYNWNIKPKNK